jgi:hypothetical protein
MLYAIHILLTAASVSFYRLLDEKGTILKTLERIMDMHFSQHNMVLVEKGSLGAAVKLLPCDHESMDSSPENSLLHKCMKRLCT